MITSEFKEYVKYRDISKVRKELLAILNTNPDMGDGLFIESLNYAVDNCGEGEVFAPYSGEFEMKSSEKEWTTSYVAKIYLQLRKEFSKELISHLSKVAPVAYSEKIAQRDLLQQTTQKTRELPKKMKDEKANFRGDCVKIVKRVLIAVLIAAVVVGFIVLGINMF